MNWKATHPVIFGFLVILSIVVIVVGVGGLVIDNVELSKFLLLPWYGKAVIGGLVLMIISIIIGTLIDPNP